jgi:hypothetical protein
MHHRSQEKNVEEQLRAALCALAHEKVSRVLFTMLVNSIKFIARLNEFQMNDDGVKSAQLFRLSRKKYYNYFTIIAIAIQFYGRLLIYEID